MALTMTELSEDYQRIEKAIHYLEINFDRQPELPEIAAAVNMSEFHFQRLFSRWVGISPKRFLQFLTKEHAKALLLRSKNLLETTYDSGLSSPGRLHDLFVTCEAVTPGEFKAHGDGLAVRYGVHPSPFGECLIAETDRGICNLMFLNPANETAALQQLRRQWKNANIVKNQPATERYVEQIFDLQKGLQESPLHLLLKGTNFQIKVWEALLQVPRGAVVTYTDIAQMIDKPKAVRAVANAIANNPIAYLIPCHRVIQKGGNFHNYRWGAARKKAILFHESVDQKPAEIPG